jgi:hypothetical protein
LQLVSIVYVRSEGKVHLQMTVKQSSQNPHPAREVMLHTVEVGVWYAVSARRNAEPVFCNETIICERFVHVVCLEAMSVVLVGRIVSSGI